MAANDTDSLDTDTISSYIEAPKKIFVIEDMEAWNPNLRSRAAIRTADTRYFVDSSTARRYPCMCRIASLRQLFP